MLGKISNDRVGINIKISIIVDLRPAFYGRVCGVVGGCFHDVVVMWW
jgi:hypothetical protein